MGWRDFKMSCLTDTTDKPQSNFISIDNKDDSPKMRGREIVPSARRPIYELCICKVESGAPVDAIWRNPYPQETLEARKESLHQIMTAIWESTFDRVKAVRPIGLVSRPEARAAEAEVLMIQQEIMAGRGKLIDFRVACEKWKKTGTK
jgi:hypothetical protein